VPWYVDEEQSTHHDSSLTRKILLFSQSLRNKKVGVTIDNIVDVFRGISFINIQKKDDFYYLLKFNLVSNREEIKLFEELFERFWSEQMEMKPFVQEWSENKDFTETEGKSSKGASKEGDKINDWNDTSGKGATAEMFPLTYSSEEVLKEKEFGHLDTEELKQVREVVVTLSQKMARRFSRHWKHGVKGDRLDFRRSIRRSMSYGGEIVELQRKKSKLKPLELVFLCDVSGSMDIYSELTLLFAYGIQNNYPHCETFVFSTRLTRVTPFLKGKPFMKALSILSQRVKDWSGGTNIGAALHQLREYHGSLFRPGRTFFLIFSDGWDRGDTGLIDTEMKRLKRKVSRLIWLNPLKGSPSYQPLCRGMATALPYIDDFLPCHNLKSLKNLAYLLP